ncbi:MAG: type II toxin-antitoxin system VapC family toxin [Acidimicrobiales bacterium]
MVLVVGAGFVVAALVDSGPVGTWADGLLGSEDLVAPHLMPVEAANILRRASLRGEISADVASMAHADLSALRAGLFVYGYEPFAARVWELRENVGAYDTWYVALAERSSATLATVDLKLSQAPGPRCSFAALPAVSSV